MSMWFARYWGRPVESRCTICGAKPVVMSGVCRDVYGQNLWLGACGKHNRRLDYALYLLGEGESGEVLTVWLNERIDAGRDND